MTQKLKARIIAGPVPRRGRVTATVLTMLMAQMFVSGAAHAVVSVGDPAPDFEVADSYGEVQRLTDFRGKMVVLEWTNHGCPFVAKHYNAGSMQSLQQEAGEQGVVWFSIISSSPGAGGHVLPEEANELTESRDAKPYAVLLDESGDVGRSFGARTTPEMVVIDGDGIVRYMGAVDDRPSSRRASLDGATNYVRDALTALAAGNAVEPAQTTPYGCSIHY